MAQRKGLPSSKPPKPKISHKGTTVRAGSTGSSRKGNKGGK